VAVSTVVVVSMAAVSAVAVSTVEASAVALSTGDVSAVALSTVVAFAVAVLVGATGMATGTITDSLMMSSSATSAFRAGGAGAIRTDITVTVTTITLTITMDTAGTHIMDTAGTVTTVAPVMGIAMEAERVMDMAMAAEPVTDTAMAADQGMSGVRGVGDKPGYGSLKIRDEATCEFSKNVRPKFGDKFGE
jgi:hypothetical protein